MSFGVGCLVLCLGGPRSALGGRGGTRRHEDAKEERLGTVSVGEGGEGREKGGEGREGRGLRLADQPTENYEQNRHKHGFDSSSAAPKAVGRNLFWERCFCRLRRGGRGFPKT